MKKIMIIGMICFSFTITTFCQNGTFVDKQTGIEIVPPLDKNGNKLPGLLIPIITKSPTAFSIKIDNEKPILSLDSIPLRYQKKYDNEIKIVEYLNPETINNDSIFVKLTGKMSFLSKDILSGKMEPTLGLRPTKMDITSLKETQKQLQYRSFKILPKLKGNSYLIIDWDTVVVVNAKIIDLKKKGAMNKKSVYEKK